jgi:hypothetical protein
MYALLMNRDACPRKLGISELPLQRTIMNGSRDDWKVLCIHKIFLIKLKEGLRGCPRSLFLLNYQANVTEMMTKRINRTKTAAVLVIPPYPAQLPPPYPTAPIL